MFKPPEFSPAGSTTRFTRPFGFKGSRIFLFIDGKAVIFRFEGSLGEPSAETGKDPDP